MNLTDAQLTSHLEQTQSCPFLVQGRIIFPTPEYEQPKPHPRVFPRMRAVMYSNTEQPTQRELPPTVSQLDLSYVIENRSTAIRFIQQNGLLHLLLEAEQPLNDFFGNKSIKTLSLEVDDEGAESVFCSVIIRGNAREAKQALRGFDQSFWLRRIGAVAGKLNFDIQLV